MEKKIRCMWASADPLYVKYHDTQWAVPVHDDQKLFEFLILEGAQAGLNWLTILKKRENYKKAFDNFEAEKIVKYDLAKTRALLSNKGIIRNRLKIESVIKNAKVFLSVQKEFGSFDSYIWRFVGGAPVNNSWTEHDKIPSMTKESICMSNDLKKRGFKFVGPVICYAFMQAVGMVNDHLTSCFRYEEIKKYQQVF